MSFPLEVTVSASNEVSPVFEEIGRSAQQTQDALGNLDGAISDGSGSWEDHKDAVNSAWKEYRFANKEFQVNNQLAFEGTRLIGSVGHAALKLTHIFTAYNTLQDNVNDAEEALNDKREKAADALSKYGASSKKYQDAKKAELKAQEKLNRVNETAIGQELAMGVATASLASDAFRVSKEFNVLNRTIAARGGIGSILGIGGTADVASGIAPLAGISGSKSFLSKIGGVRGAAGIATAGIGASLAAAAAFTPENQKSFNDKLFSTLGQVGSFAATGALIGAPGGITAPIGAAIGGGVGLAVGLGTNFQEEFGNLFSGKGFVSNADLARAGGGINIAGDLHVHTTGVSSQQIMDSIHREMRTRDRLVSSVG